MAQSPTVEHAATNANDPAELRGSFAFVDRARRQRLQSNHDLSLAIGGFALLAFGRWLLDIIQSRLPQRWHTTRP